MKKAVRSLARQSALNSGNNFSSGPRLLSAEPRLSRRVTSGPETVGEVGGGERRRGEGEGDRNGRFQFPRAVVSRKPDVAARPGRGTRDFFQ